MGNVKPVLSSNQKDKIFEYRIQQAVQRQYTPNYWQDLTTLQLELLCMVEEGKISVPVFRQGMEEARQYFDKKKKVRVG